MAILLGIDEAGYGPILGPLVVTAVAVEVPDALLDKPLWEVLRQSVYHQVSKSAGRVVIADSKKLKQAKGNYSRLERGVLAGCKAWGKELPVTLGELLRPLDVGHEEELKRYPWYEGRAEKRALGYDRGDIATAAGGLAHDMKSHGVAVRGFWSRVLWVEHYNELVERVKNKAMVSFGQVSELMAQAYREFGQENLQIVVDRQGGRSHYRDTLGRCFPHATMKILKEAAGVSSYSLTEPKRAMKVHFLEKGETRQLPIAWASMTSKYVREIFVGMLNDYFQGMYPELQATAGYYQDGMRFLKDLEAMGWHGDALLRRKLVRSR